MEVAAAIRNEPTPSVGDVARDPRHPRACAALGLGPHRVEPRPSGAVGVAVGPAAGASHSVPLDAALTGAADQQFVGWSYWAGKRYGDPTGNLHKELVDDDDRLAPNAGVVSQTYPAAVAGRPLHCGSRRRPAFHLTYTADPDARTPTVVVVPVVTLHPHGSRARVEGGTARSVPDADRLVVRNARGAGTVTVAMSGRLPAGPTLPMRRTGTRRRSFGLVEGAGAGRVDAYAQRTTVG